MTNQQRIALIKERLEAAFTPSFLQIDDESAAHIGHPGAQSGAGHFAVTIAAPELAEKTRVTAHQLIYSTVNDLIPKEIHALRIILLDCKDNSL